MNLHFRVLLTFLVLIAVAVYFLAEREISSVSRRSREASEESLIEFANVLASIAALEFKSDEGLSPNFRAALESARTRKLSARVFNLEKHGIDTRVYVTDSQGIVIFDSDHNSAVGQDYSRWNDVFKTLRGEYGARTSRDSPDARDSIMYIAAPVIQNGKLVASLTVAKSNRSANQLIEIAQSGIFNFAVLVLAIACVVAFLLSHLITNPLRALTGYVQALSEGRKARLPTLRTHEIRRLASAFENMRLSLEGKKYIERYVQTVTHELKSPLTGIRGAVELLKEDLSPGERLHFLSNIDIEAARIQAIADKLLELTTLQRQAFEKEEILAPQELLTEAAQALQMQVEQKCLSLIIKDAPGLEVTGNRFWLTEALKNLLQNAIDFSPSDGEVTVTTTRTGNCIRIDIADQGPGVPPWAQEKIFEQFFSLPRPDTQRRSSGLGLSLVKEILDQHGGSILLINGEQRGVTARVELPVKENR